VLEFLTQSGAPLPWATRALLGYVSLLSSPLFWLALALAVLIGVQVLVLASRRGSALRFEGWLMRTPRLGRCATDFYSLRFGRALLSGLASGYPLLGAVDLAARCCGSATIEQQARAVTAAMVAGQTPEQAFGQMVALDPVLVRCIPLGLSLGQVEPLLGAGLRLGEERLRCSVEAFLALLEPVLLAFMGGLVALCVLATVSPMLSLLQGVL
jgi:type II secretory pathway component PulF